MIGQFRRQDNVANGKSGCSHLAQIVLNLLEMRHYPVGEIVLSCSLMANEENREETYHY